MGEQKGGKVHFSVAFLEVVHVHMTFPRASSTLKKHKHKRRTAQASTSKVKEPQTTKTPNTRQVKDTTHSTTGCLSESSTCPESRGKRRNSERVEEEQIQLFHPPVHLSFHKQPHPFLPLPLRHSAASATTRPLTLRTHTPAAPRPSAKESAPTLASRSAPAERSAPSKRATHRLAIVSRLIATRRRRATLAVMTSAPSASLMHSTKTQFCVQAVATSSTRRVSPSGFRTDGQVTSSVSAGLTVLFVTRRWATLSPVAATTCSSETPLSSERRSCRGARRSPSQSPSSRP